MPAISTITATAIIRRSISNAIHSFPRSSIRRKRSRPTSTGAGPASFGLRSPSATPQPPPAHLGGSNPRAYYVSFYGTLFLYNQYTRNNLYIYPEHHDHDPGHSGVFFPNPLNHAIRDEGYGDLYPTNTPYLIISQGSSGSDQPFMAT